MKKTLAKYLMLFAALCALWTAAGQDDRIERQKRIIADLEQRIARGEREIASIKKGRAATEERLRRLARQIDSRSQLLDATEQQAALLRLEIERTDSVAGDLSAALERNREQYGAMAREAYRNYRHNNYLTYLFASRSFVDVARKITMLREVAAMRERKLAEIDSLAREVAGQRTILDTRRRALDSVLGRLASQKEKLQRDARSARSEASRLSRREKTALQQKMAREQELDVAISELRKLTRGNTAGASFSNKTTGLRLPVVGGRVKRYMENMAEITGEKGAAVISIYDGKVVEIKRNRITNKYDVFVAHGEYITSYANLGEVSVAKGQKVSRNQRLGSIGSAMNVVTMEPEYKLVFGIYPPSPNMKMRAQDCFRR